MKITKNKSLIREIAPGVIVIGNNPFEPLLRIDQIAMKADILGDEVPTEEDITNLEISIQTLNDEIDSEEATRIENIQSIDIRIGEEETAREDNVASIDTRFTNLPSGGGGGGISEAQAADIAKKWAIILG